MRILEASEALWPNDELMVCVTIEPTDRALTAEDAEKLVGAEAQASLPLRGEYPPLRVERAWLTPSGRIYAELRPRLTSVI